MSSGDMAAVNRLAAHNARPRRNGDAAGQEKTKTRGGREGRVNRSNSEAVISHDIVMSSQSNNDTVCL